MLVLGAALSGSFLSALSSSIDNLGGLMLYLQVSLTPSEGKRLIGMGITKMGHV